MTAPSAPGASTSIRLFRDTADSYLKLKDSLNTDVNVSGILRGPATGIKWGGYTATSITTGFGIIGTLTNTGTPTASLVDSTNGFHCKIVSAASTGSNAGNKFASPFFARCLNSYFGIKFRLVVGSGGSLANIRAWIGLKWTSTDPGSGVEDPLATGNYGVMIVKRVSPADTNWMLCTNNGSANSNFADSGVAISANTIYTLLIRAVGDTKFQWSINGSPWADLTTQIPDSTRPLVYLAQLQTAENVAHEFHCFGVEATSDK
jgi:hypothetical protein